MNGWVEILFTYDEVEAQIVKQLLEGEGIRVVIDSAKIRPYPVSIGRIGEVRVMVREEEFERAREILRAMEDRTGRDEGDR
jgi:hypothetical protein